MKVKVGQFWRSRITTSHPTASSHIGVWITQETPTGFLLEWVKRTGELIVYGTTSAYIWKEDEITNDFKLDESYQVKEILSYYD